MNKVRVVQAIFAATARVVKYECEDGKAKIHCPVCEFLRIDFGKVEVYKTAGEIRYCCCAVCNARFRAIGQSHSKLPPELAESKKQIDNKVKGKKADGRAKKRTKTVQRR